MRKRLINRNPEIVKIIWEGTHLKFKCKKCGQEWYPDWKRLNWQCPNGCKTEVKYGK